MQDFTDALGALRRRLDEAEGYLGIAELNARQPQLEAEMSRPDLWDDADAARRVQTELTEVNDDLELFASLGADLEDAETLVELADEENDDSLEDEIVEALAQLAERFATLELRSLFSGEYDERDAVCHIQSGAGGTDARTGPR